MYNSSTFLTGPFPENPLLIIREEGVIKYTLQPDLIDLTWYNGVYVYIKARTNDQPIALRFVSETDAGTALLLLQDGITRGTSYKKASVSFPCISYTDLKNKIRSGTLIPLGWYEIENAPVMWRFQYISKDVIWIYPQDNEGRLYTLNIDTGSYISQLEGRWYSFNDLNEWIIVHNLGYTPKIFTYNENRETLLCSIDIINMNSFKIEFNKNFSGLVWII